MELDARESAPRSSHGKLVAGATVHVVEDGSRNPSRRDGPEVLDRVRALKPTPEVEPHRSRPKQLPKLAPSRELPVGQSSPSMWCCTAALHRSRGAGSGCRSTDTHRC